jgi:serine acetyltransferase
VIQHVRLGTESVVGAGAVVINDVPPLTTVVGVPAKPIRGPSAESFARTWLVPDVAEARAPLAPALRP